MTLRLSPIGIIPAGVSQHLSGATLADVADEAEEVGEVGHADFRFELNYNHANGLITNVDLTMHLTVVLPVWDNHAKRPKPEKDEWDRFLRALRAHEDGHIAIFQREAPTTYNRLRAAKPKTMEKVLADETARIWRLSKVYDHQTDHGRKQQTPHGTTVIQVP
ncbi:MAG: DUF922 domain-containing protein [Gemmatimonadetes bacterium]|nr:DUF922 domain-containing protein [Gemmatimonadota bacterium]